MVEDLDGGGLKVGWQGYFEGDGGKAGFAWFGGGAAVCGGDLVVAVVCTEVKVVGCEGDGDRLGGDCGGCGYGGREDEAADNYQN